MLSTVESRPRACAWTIHNRQCPQMQFTALRLPSRVEGRENLGTSEEFAAHLRRASSCGSQAHTAAVAGPPRGAEQEHDRGQRRRRREPWPERKPRTRRWQGR